MKVVLLSIVVAFYTTVAAFAGVGLYFTGTSNGWFENIVFAAE